MKAKQQIESWKSADASQENTSPAESVNVQESIMRNITGGANSAGLICSISGECNKSGRDCNFIDALYAIFD